MEKKPNLGRQKIKIEKIQKKNHLQVTFSKRRLGVFKKASELSTLCGVEIAIVVFSPAGKVFSFGHPDVESVTDRFLGRNVNLHSTSLRMVASSVPELNMELTYAVNELEAQKKRSEELDEMRKDGQNQFWWEAPIEKMNLHELEQLRDSMEELKKCVDAQVNKVLVESSNAMSIFGSNVDQHEMMKNVGPMISSSVSGAGPSNGYGDGYGYGYGDGLF